MGGGAAPEGRAERRLVRYARGGYQGAVYATASILLSIVLDPATVLLAVLAAGVVLLWTRWRNAGRAMAAAATLAFAAVAAVPVGSWLVSPLEDRFPPPEPSPSRVHGIVVLGGAVALAISTARGQPSLSGNAERLTAFAMLARRHPEARLIYTGGYRSLKSPEITEGEVASALLSDLGVDTARLAVDDGARNTMDNAERAFELASPQPGETWLLVTSARHMPRAMGAFRKAGWPDVVPYPVDYRTAASAAREFGLRSGLKLLKHAQHEWIGLAVYRLMGKSSELFPAP